MTIPDVISDEAQLEPRRLRPAAPVPHTTILTTFAAMQALRRNPLEAFGAPAYRLPFVYRRSRIQDFLLVNDPDAIRHVLLDNAENYAKGRQTQRLLRPALGNGLVTAEGASWRSQRRIIAPMFQLRRIVDFAPVMAEAAEEVVARWKSLPEGAVLDLTDEITHLTYNVISRTVFANDVTMDYTEMSRAVVTYLETVGRIDFAGQLGMPYWFPTPARLRARPVLRFFRQSLEGLIVKRRSQLESGSPAPNDLLTLLLTARDPEDGKALSESEIFDNVVTFVFAGHETTANALAWTLYLLSQFPDVDMRLERELRDVLGGRRVQAADLPTLSYTRMVLEESMRLYPPAPFISRAAIAADKFKDRTIRAGTAVLISPWILHRHQSLWPAPDYFDPERFAAGARDKIHRFAYLPFGAGPRICIGMGFAMQEAMILLATLARDFRFTLEPGHPVVPQSRITLRPKYGLKMRLARRQI